MIYSEFEDRFAVSAAMLSAGGGFFYTSHASKMLFKIKEQLGLKLFFSRPLVLINNMKLQNHISGKVYTKISFLITCIEYRPIRVQNDFLFLVCELIFNLVMVVRVTLL